MLFLHYQVDAVSKTCMAVQGGHEMEFTVFDILVSTVHDTRALTKMEDELPDQLAKLKLSMRSSACNTKKGKLNKKYITKICRYYDCEEVLINYYNY